MSDHETALAAIKESVHTNRTVHIPWEEYSEATADTLSAESDSGPQEEPGLGVRYWGHDSEGNEWTVVLAAAIPEDA